jgi:hypothetical protein
MWLVLLTVQRNCYHVKRRMNRKQRKLKSKILKKNVYNTKPPIEASIRYGYYIEPLLKSEIPRNIIKDFCEHCIKSVEERHFALLFPVIALLCNDPYAIEIEVCSFTPQSGDIEVE